MSQQEQRIAREEARLHISETLATATTLHSEGVNGKRPIVKREKDHVLTTATRRPRRSKAKHQRNFSNYQYNAQ